MSPLGLITEGEALAQAQPKLSELKKATSGVEAIFVKNLLDEMQKGMKDGLFGDVPGAGIYQDLMNTSIAQAVAKGGSFGIGDLLYRQMSAKVVAEAMAAAPRQGAPTSAPHKSGAMANGGLQADKPHKASFPDALAGRAP